MKTLIIHHLEPMWEGGYSRAGTCFEDLCVKVGEHITSNDYDQIILTRFESHQLDEPEYDYLAVPYIQVKEYGYGWELDGFLDDDETEKVDEIRQRIENGEVYETRFGTKLAEGGSHSQVVIIDEWMERLPKQNVFICGAFDGECVEDLETALSAINVNFQRVEELIV
jgi:hypothetical protein